MEEINWLIHGGIVNKPFAELKRSQPSVSALNGPDFNKTFSGRALKSGPSKAEMDGRDAPL